MIESESQTVERPDASRHVNAPQARAILLGAPRNGSTHAPVVLRRWPAGSKVPATLLAMARLALVTDTACTREFKPAHAASPITITAMPMNRRSKPKADTAIAVVIDTVSATHDREGPGRPPEARWIVTTQSPAREARTTVERDSVAPGNQDRDDEDLDDPLAASNHASTALGLLARINGEKRFSEAALVFVDRLAYLTNAQRAGLGFLTRNATRVHALSGNQAANHDAAMMRDLALAMDEAIEQVSTVVYPADPGGPRVTLAHGRFAMRYGAPLLCTIPILLAQDGERSLIGAISLEFGQNRNLEERAIRFAEHAAALLGPYLYNLRHLDAAPTARLRRGLPGNRHALLRQHPRRLLWIAACCAALIAAGMFVPIDDRITAPARVEGATQRQIGAPAQGFIGSVHARPGDLVKEGQLLIALDDRELELESMKWSARLAELEKRYGEALAGEDQSEIAIARSEVGQARAQLDMITEKKTRLSIRAPFDGVVISGDLTRSLGAPVQRGESLVAIAPAGQYRVVIEVDERDIAKVAIGQTGRLVTTAGGETLSLVVTGITPIASSGPGGTRFEIEASLPVDVADVRPGLQGFAKIETGTRAALPQATDRLRRWLRLAIWRWQL